MDQKHTMDILRDLFESYTGQKAVRIVQMGGSGSNRKYFRIYAAITLIGVCGTDRDENAAFIALSRHFAAKGLNVPKVLAVCEDGMAYLQEDLGDKQLYGAISGGRESGNYSAGERLLLCRTMSMLSDLQFLGADGLDWSLCYPESEFSARMVMFDLNYFKYCFLKLSGLEFNEVKLQDDFERLCSDLVGAGMPGCGKTSAFMYRDFQARNVMLKDGEPYFIDFQGGRKGPIYYDVASFVWQARSRYPDDLKEEMIGAYLASARKYLPELDETVFRSELRLFVLFRTLQVLGAYGFRGYIEKKPHFIKSVPFAIDNLKTLLQTPFENYPYLNEILGKLVSLKDWKIFDHGARPASPEPDDSAAERTKPGCGSKEEAPCSGQHGPEPLTVTVYSFSYKKGIPADDTGHGGGFVFDCRALNNPGRYEFYRQFNGRDQEVIKFLEDDGGIFPFLDHTYSLVDPHVQKFLDRGFTNLQICFGCTGGRHRSVYSAQRMAEHIAAKFGGETLKGADSGRIRIRLIHREMGIEEIL